MRLHTGRPGIGLRPTLAALVLLVSALAVSPARALDRGAAEFAEPPPPVEHDALPPAPPEDLYAEHADLYADEAFLDDELAAGPAEPDPIEDVNRAVFGFNDQVDRWVFEPVARAYGWVLPEPAKRAVLRFLANLNSTSIFMNDVLQLEPKLAGVTLGRFVVNTTVGLVGILDVARHMDMPGHDNGFGTTLARAGVSTGPYLMIPVLGPTTPRDAVGGAVDLLFRPQTYLLGPAEFIVLGTTRGVATREAYVGEIDALRDASVDYYATIRNVYFQRRAEQVRAISEDRSEPDGEFAISAGL